MHTDLSLPSLPSLHLSHTLILYPYLLLLHLPLPYTPLFLFASLPHVLLLPISLLPSFQVVGTVVDLFGTLEFINNTAPQDEAALHLRSFGQVRLQRGLDMTFAGNIGRCGQVRCFREDVSMFDVGQEWGS